MRKWEKDEIRKLKELYFKYEGNQKKAFLEARMCLYRSDDSIKCKLSRIHKDLQSQPNYVEPQESNLIIKIIKFLKEKLCK